MNSKKKHYWLLVLDIISCVFFICMLWMSYAKNFGNTFNYTWKFFLAITLFSTFTEVRKISK